MTQQTERPPGFVPEEANAFPFDPTDPAFRIDPYPVYNALRDNAPVMKLPMGLLVLSRHKDCVGLLHSPNGSTDQRNSAMYKAYIEGEGWHTPSTKPVFGRDLIAAVPGLHRRRNKAAGYFYEGIALKGEPWNG